MRFKSLQFPKTTEREVFQINYGHTWRRRENVFVLIVYFSSSSEQTPFVFVYQQFLYQKQLSHFMNEKGLYKSGKTIILVMIQMFTNELLLCLIVQNNSIIKKAKIVYCKKSKTLSLLYNGQGANEELELSSWDSKRSWLNGSILYNQFELLP